MAFTKLFPREGSDPLSNQAILRSLRDEFPFVDVDPDEGRDHVAGMIAATLRFPDDLPWKQERIAWLMSIQESAALVSFGNSLDHTASFCLMSGEELFFDEVNVIRGPDRPFLDRAAAALGYIVYDG